MIPIRTLSLFAYFTYIFIDIIIYTLESTPWSSGIFWMVGRVIVDPSMGLPSLCGVVPQVPIQGIEFSANLIVLESEGIEIILGMDWLRKHNRPIESTKKAVG
jgi:hypothetical protein